MNLFFSPIPNRLEFILDSFYYIYGTPEGAEMYEIYTMFKMSTIYQYPILILKY